MQTVVTAPVIERPGLAIRLETVVYFLIIAFALVFRLVNLGGVPMSEGETHQALAAYRAIVPDSSGIALTPTSPILFALQGLSFGLIGGSEFAARLLTAIGGALLVISPLLFRRELGSTRTFVFSLLLLLSPVELVASRFSAPVIWSMIFAILLLWSIWSLRRSRDTDDDSNVWIKSLAAVSAAGLILLSEPGGIVLTLILIGAALVAFVWDRQTRPFDFDAVDEKPKTSDSSRDVISGWSVPLIVAVTFVILVATGILLYPAGLNAIGELFTAFGVGLNQAPVGSLQSFPLVISLFYEPFWWALAIAGIIVLINRHALTLIDRFLIGWLVFAVLASLVYDGADAVHALWLTVPLIGLTTSAVLAMLAPVRSTDVFAPPVRARWIIAAAAIAVITVFTMSAQALARSMLNSTGDSLMTVTPNANSVILVIVSLMFMLIGFFLVASVWGNKTSLQGIGLGVLIFGVLTSFGSGWSAAVSDNENPREPFHFYATSQDVMLLRETLHELAERNSGGFNAMPLTVMAPQDGVIAWIVRDFSKAEYITDLRDAVGDPIALLPSFEEPPALGTSYVGQDFITRRTWTPTTIYTIDTPTWWMQRHARFSWMTLDTSVLWLRQDVYEGTRIEEPAAG